ncbi:ATP-binding cassette domain-containing protein [Mesorhizobium sp. B3-1-6]|uniref:ATP-binding cassette domain-containing protein n=1 Tax=Mesorhizobium sp. B3-1-6 TaxID=2589895 RepID=UPI001FEEC904|nr:ATP-binding cassette domain-containing protein [Mesorhizobium sp. B3-1-6]
MIGENGAGKSTLMNILAGDLRPDGGKLLVEGREVKLSSPLDSRAHGITVVYQELALCPTMSVAENIMMSDMAARSAVSLLPRDMMRREARDALTRLGMGGLDPDTKVGRLSVAEMQLVEIAGAIRQNARVLVLDEPNSALSKRESGKAVRGRQATPRRGRDHHLRIAPSARGAGYRRPRHGDARWPHDRDDGQ